MSLQLQDVIYSGGEETYWEVTSSLFSLVPWSWCCWTPGYLWHRWGLRRGCRHCWLQVDIQQLLLVHYVKRRWNLLSECGAWGVGQGLMERLREATPSGGWITIPSCHGHADSHQIPDSWWPLILLLLLVAFLRTDSQGDGWRICSWILKFLSECLCSVYCLIWTQPGSRPASSHWFRRFATYHEISKLQAFWAEVMRTEWKEVCMS